MDTYLTTNAIIVRMISSRAISTGGIVPLSALFERFSSSAKRACLVWSQINSGKFGYLSDAIGAICWLMMNTSSQGLHTENGLFLSNAGSGRLLDDQH